MIFSDEWLYGSTSFLLAKTICTPGLSFLEIWRKRRGKSVSESEGEGGIVTHHIEYSSFINRLGLGRDLFDDSYFFLNSSTVLEPSQPQSS